MAKSLVGKMMNLAKRPIPFNDQWNTKTGLWGYQVQDRFSQLQTMGVSGTLYSIVQLLYQGTARHEWRLFRKTQDGRQRYTRSDLGSDQRKEIMPGQHLALNLWNRPNPFFTGLMFRQTGWQFMELVGEWYWVLNRGESGTTPPTEIWPVRPDRMEPVPDKERYLAGWVYTGPNGEMVPLTTDEVIQVRYPDPTDFYRGMSPVQSLLADIDNVKYTSQWSRNFFLNSAVPGGIVTFAKRLSDTEFTEFTNRWREQHQGVARGHRVGVLEQGAAWTPNTYTMKDMQFVELKNVSREVIREAYRIHQAMLGLSNDVNRANAQTAAEIHVAWHEVPRLVITRDVLNHFYLPTFGSTGNNVEFDYVDPTPATPEDANIELKTKAGAALVLIQAGFDPHEVLEAVGLPDMKYVAQTEQIAPRPSAPVGVPLTKPVVTGPEGDPGQPNQNDDDVMNAYSDMIRDAFADLQLKRASNGHAKEVLIS